MFVMDSYILWSEISKNVVMVKQHLESEGLLAEPLMMLTQYISQCECWMEQTERSF